MHLKDLKQKTPADLVAQGRGDGDRGRIDDAQAGPDVLHPQGPRRKRRRDQRHGHDRSAQRRVRLPAQPRGQLSRRARRHLCRAQRRPPLRPAHRRHDRGRNPRPQGRRALFRADQGHADQFRRPRSGPPPGQFRQSDPALSRFEADPRQRRSDPEGQVGAGDRHRRSAGQGPARADRRAAAHRQDRAAAEHRQGDHRQPPRGVPAGAAGRRAAGGSHRHAAQREGRGDQLDLRRARVAPRPGRRNGDREGQAPGRAQEGCRHPARFHHPPWPRLQHRRASRRARC